MIRKKYLFYFLCLGVGLFSTDYWVHGARIAGEEDVSPAAPAIEQEVPRRDAPRPEGDAVILKKLTPPSPTKDTKEGSVQEESATKAKGDSKPGEDDNRYVTIDFDNVDIGIFIKFISELTGKNFVIDSGVRGKVTIISPTKISVKEAYKVFESVLEVNGFTTVPSGRVIKIVPGLEARSKSIETRLREDAVSPEDKVVTQLIPLKYAEPDELQKLFTPLISKSSIIVSYPPTRMLIVTDVLSNINRLLHITKAIDVEGVGEEITVVPLKHGTASVMANSLSMVFQTTGKSIKKGAAPPPIIKIVPDDRTNVLILLASEDDTAKVKQLIDLLDKETPKGEGDIRVYYLQHANAEELTKVLISLPSEQAKPGEKGKPPVISKETRIVADKATNSLVITAKKDDYLVLEEVIKKLDIPRMMVYIEALIMEVNVDKDFQLGVEWVAGKKFTYEGKDGAAFGGFNYGNLVTSPPTFPTGFALGVIGPFIEIGGIQFPNLAAVVSALQKDRDVHILSTPQVLTTDNQEAEIMVGRNVPYITRQETTEARLDYTTYEYKDVGVTLKITPQISQERLVRLNIFQEVTRLIPTSETDRPETFKRKAQTTVIVKDSNTVVIGGLIDDDTSVVETKVPCLGDIPGLGWLFRSTIKSSKKTNLFVFLTPHIIENPVEAKKVYHEKKDQIERIKEGVIKMYKKPRQKDDKQG
ncbi:MAG: type II secretion system secretin GspD [Pseudomonadota bacterium]